MEEAGFLAYLASHADLLLETAFAIIAAASAVTALTPTPRDDIFIGKLYKGLEWLALNIGRAKDQPPNRIGGRFVAQ